MLSFFLSLSVSHFGVRALYGVRNTLHFFHFVYDEGGHYTKMVDDVSINHSRHVCGRMEASFRQMMRNFCVKFAMNADGVPKREEEIKQDICSNMGGL